jgi:non-ribosomal peptide synthetase component F
LRAGPPPIPTKADISYGPFPHQLLDIYVPPQGAGPFPVVLWYGTIWQPGKHAPDVNLLFAGHCAAIAVETRTMTDATADKVAAPVSYVMLDARRAVQFVRLHAAEYNLDPNRIATAGSSQGTLPALYVACAGEKADPTSTDPVERTSTKVTCVGAWRSQPSIDPKVMQQWVPGVKWGAPALGCGFDESLQKRDQLLPIISQWSPDALLNKDTPPIYFHNNWGLTKPADVKDADYLVHSPLWALGFQKLAESRGATVYVDFPGHPSEKYKDMWDFLVQQLNSSGK